jgi:hypothetical protein
MRKTATLPLLNLLTFVLMVVLNGLANALPINGQTTGEISDSFAVYFVPAGYVFSIWGLIYLGLLAFAIYQLLPAQRNNARLGRIGYWFAIGSLANSAWILLWHYEFFPLTLVVMLVLLVSLIAIYLRLNIGRVQVPSVEKWLVHVPFGIYLGWITVATVANATALLEYWKWGGWGLGPATWAVIMLSIAAALGAAMSLTRGDVAYVLVLVWAFVGIAVKHWATPLVGWTAALLALLLVLTLVAGVPRARRRSASV